MAVHAHNSAAHSVTKYPPEEVLSGRKIKRGLPLIDFSKAAVDDALLSKRDKEAKLSGKEREDRRRGARSCRVKPGDTVIIQRHTRGKAESRFSPRRYTVTDDKNGSLTLNDDDGQVLKRHVSQTKKVSQWRNEDSPTISNVPSSHPVNNTPRSTRDRKAPAYLQEYVQLINKEL